MLVRPLFSAVALSSLAVAAFAADLPFRKAPPAVYIPPRRSLRGAAFMSA
jgi:hypothetical protein